MDTYFVTKFDPVVSLLKEAERKRAQLAAEKLRAAEAAKAAAALVPASLRRETKGSKLVTK